jgi:hypothetical protein
VPTRTNTPTVTRTPTATATNTAATAQLPNDHKGENVALYFQEGGTLGVNNAGVGSCGGTASNCNLTVRSDAAADTLNFKQGVQSVGMTRAGGGDLHVANATAPALTRSTATSWGSWAPAGDAHGKYPRFRDRVTFIIVDVEHPSDAQRALLAAHYHGSIPTVVVFAPNGAVLYAQPGETASKRGDTHALEALLTRAVGE